MGAGARQELKDLFEQEVVAASRREFATLIATFNGCVEQLRGTYAALGDRGEYQEDEATPGDEDEGYEDFVKRLLCEPKKRLSGKQAKKHDWIKRGAKLNDAPLGDGGKIDYKAFLPKAATMLKALAKALAAAGRPPCVCLTHSM